ncbi:MAG TPA: hypothetical protein VNJ08_03170 [Bacteriovoracaceae bacterium]|nr:hypothetical protein [Bacteriovoracaceae bacterium]
MKLSIVILENALTTWNQPQTRKIVNDVVALKAEGYGRAFKDPLLVIPLDVFEFVGTHILLYRGETLIMGYKTVSLADCLKMNLTFPMQNVVNSPGAEAHKVAYNKFVSEFELKCIHYDCHLTVSDQAAKNPDLLYECLSILYALVYHYRQDYQVDYSFMLGTFFAGTHKTFLKMGTKIFCDLGPINLSFYDKREALIMLCDRSFSAKSIELALKYEYLWKERSLINGPSYEKSKVA